MKNTRKKQYSKKRHSTRKGGFYNFFKKKPKTTQEELNDLQRILQNTSLKNFENMFIKEMDLLKKKREQCIFNCKKSSMEYKDVELRNQLNSMIDTKSDYEWGNLCANSIKVSDCVDYLKSYKKVEFYKNYLDQINKNTQNLFNNYKNSNEAPKMNNSMTSTSTINSNTNSVNSISSDDISTPLLEKNSY
jgi:DNA topoisomerase VI subunit B